ncbi:MAG: hypothetical protein ACJ739_12160 [Acidimicrobiales bacterium]
MAPSAAPETVTEAVSYLAEEGYAEDLRVVREGIVSREHEGALAPEGVIVDHTFRFEGPSDPGDEMIVLGVRCPEWDTLGVITSAYGPDMEPEEAEILMELTRGRSGVTPPQAP